MKTKLLTAFVAVTLGLSTFGGVASAALVTQVLNIHVTPLQGLIACKTRTYNLGGGQSISYHLTSPTNCQITMVIDDQVYVED